MNEIDFEVPKTTKEVKVSIPVTDEVYLGFTINFFESEVDGRSLVTICGRCDDDGVDIQTQEHTGERTSDHYEFIFEDFRGKIIKFTIFVQEKYRCISVEY